MLTASNRLFLLFGLIACGQEYQIGAAVDLDLADVLDCDFTPISGTQMSLYDCNPVFTGTGENWSQSFVSTGFRTQNVLGHPFYQIWYTAQRRNGSYGLGYAVSSDGTTWQAHPDNPVVRDDRGWDQDSMDQVRVVWDDLTGRYVLAYQGFNAQLGTFGLGVMTSPNGVDWTPFNDGQPMLDFTVPAATGVTYCWPVGFSWAADRGFFGYLGGSPADEPGPNGFGVCQIYDFAAPSLESGFVLGRDPILAAGPEPYDAAGMGSAAPFQVNGVWYMFYVGFRTWVDNPNSPGLIQSQGHSLNLATSLDGRTWTKHPDNPLPVALTSPGVIRQVAAQPIGSRVLLWITDYYDDIGENAVGYYLFEPGGPIHP